MTHAEAERIEKGFSEWANREPSLRPLAIVGSWARGMERDDSDLDVLVLSEDFPKWASEDRWLHHLIRRIGLSIASLTFEVHGVARSWRVCLGSGAELELTLADVGWANTAPLRIPTKPAMHSKMKPATCSDPKPAGVPI